MQNDTYAEIDVVDGARQPLAVKIENQDVLPATDDEHVAMPFTKKDYVGDVVGGNNYHVNWIIKWIGLTVYVVQFIFTMIYGLTATDNLVINADKSILVDPSESATCAAEKIAEGAVNAGSDFRCKKLEDIGNPDVMAMLMVFAGWIMIITLWRAVDWGRVIGNIINKCSGGNHEIDQMKVFKFSRKLKYQFAYPLTEDLINTNVHDTDENLWKWRTWSAFDLFFFMILSGALGQTNIYLLIYTALLGFCFSLSGYCQAYNNRLKRREDAESSEEGILLSFAPAIAHIGILIVMTFTWWFQYGDLAAHSNPRWYSLYLLLCYFIYLWAYEIWNHVYDLLMRVTCLKGMRFGMDTMTQIVGHRSTKHFVDSLAFIVFSGGLLGYALLIGSEHDHLMI